MFKRYDRSLRFAYPVLYAFTGLSALGVLICDIVCIVNNDYITGLVIMLSGFSSVIFFFTVVHVFFDHCMDSKIIRNKLYESACETETKAENKTTVYGSGSGNAQPQTDIVAVAQAEHIRRLEQLYTNGLLTQAEYETLKLKTESDFEIVAAESVDSISSR